MKKMKEHILTAICSVLEHTHKQIYTGHYNISYPQWHLIMCTGENDVHVLSKHKIEETVAKRSGRRIKLGEQMTTV